LKIEKFVRVSPIPENPPEGEMVSRCFGVTAQNRLWSHARLCLLAVLISAPSSFAQDKNDYIPQPGQFPPADSGRYIAGELVTVDPINRRGMLRIDGDPGRYQFEVLHPFAMLPYGMVWFNGAPAELRDIPVGTHVHGYFFLPALGEETTVAPSRGDPKNPIPQNHAISLEDDFSFYQRRGQAWKVVSVDTTKGKIQVISTGKTAADGLSGPKTFDIDSCARVWNERKLVEWTDITPEQVVQMNLTYCPGFAEGEHGVLEIWLDEESRKASTELQRRKHIRYQHIRWLPGWVDHVEHNDFGGGIVTLTLFGGMDPSLYDECRATREKGFGIAAAEKTLRTWAHRADKKIGQVVEWKEIENPPLGSSGIQIRLKFTELLDGYRPGRIIRLKCDPWIFTTVPPEDRMKSLEDRS
jgi:hypothetical protein